MKILIIGSGGREDAFAWRFNSEPKVSEIFVSPGHAGMDRLDKVTLLGKRDHQELVAFAKENAIDLTVIGPEAPLTAGLADLFNQAGLTVCGPSKMASQLEGSKIFSKEFMNRHQIPTADFEVYDNFEAASVGLEKWPVEEEGIVLKADGLAGGKGVVVTFEREKAKETLYDFMVNPNIQVKTDKILMEKVLPGEEVSVFILAHGEEFLYLGAACDHKRLLDNDQGPNTGGMGCFYDPLWPDEELKNKVIERVVTPTLKGMKSEGMSYSGFLFLGLMIDDKNDPYVVEYNVRFGDPETQTLMPVIEGDFSTFLFDFFKGNTPNPLKLKKDVSVHVVATSGGYPSLDDTPMDLGHLIKLNRDQIDLCIDNGEGSSFLFYAGVTADPAGRGLMNTGGRVLGVTSLGASIEDARKKAYYGLDQISFKGMHYRSDIAKKKRGQRS